MATETETTSDSELKEWFEESVSCTYCSSAAVWVTPGHQPGGGCPGEPGLHPKFRCETHFIDWKHMVDLSMKVQGFIRCGGCKGDFPSEAVFSPHRKF